MVHSKVLKFMIKPYHLSKTKLTIYQVKNRQKSKQKQLISKTKIVIQVKNQ